MPEEYGEQIGRVEQLKKQAETKTALSSPLQGITETARRGQQELSRLMPALKTSEAAQYLRNSIPIINSYLRSIADKGFSILQSRKDGNVEAADVVPISNLKSSLLNSLNEQKNELAILEKIEAFDRREKELENTEKEIDENPNLKLEEKLKAYLNLSKTVTSEAGAMPKTALTAEGNFLINKINQNVALMQSKIGYKVTDLNIAKQCREKYAKYVSVDDSGNITYAPAFKELKISNPAEYKNIMNEILRGVTGAVKAQEQGEPSGTDFMKIEAEIAQLNRKMDEYKKAVEAFEKNPTPDAAQRLDGLRPELKYPGFPGSKERADMKIKGGEFITDAYAAIDRVSVPYKKLRETMAALDERIKNKEAELNKEAVTQLMTALDTNWNEIVKPKTAEYAVFKTASMAEYLLLIVDHDNRFKLMPDKQTIRENHKNNYNKISEEVLRSMLTVELMISPFMAKNIDKESRAKIEARYKESEKYIEQVEQDRLVIKSTQSLLKIESSSGVNVLTYVKWKDKSKDGKNYEIDEDVINNLPLEKRDMVRSQIRLMIAQNLESVKNETGTALDELQKVDPQKAIAKMREKFGEKGKLFFDAVQMMESGDLNASAKVLHDFAALYNGLSAEEKTELQPLMNESQEKIKIIAARQMAMLELLDRDIHSVFSPLEAAKRRGSSLTPKQNDQVAGEEIALGNELFELKGKVKKGEILDMNAEIARIKQKLATGANRYGRVEKLVQMYEAQNDLHSTDPAKKAAAIKILQKFADGATDMDTRLYDMGKKYLDMILEEQKKESEAEAIKKGITRDEVVQSIIASPSAMAAIRGLAKQYYDQMIKENPKAKDKITIEQAEQFVLRRKTEELYSTRLRQVMSESPKYKDDLTLKMYDKWFPVNQAKYWEVWKYSLEEQHLFADECGKLVFESLLTLPVGVGAGAVGKLVTRMAMKGIIKMAGERAGLEAGLLMMERSGLLALRAGSAEMEMLAPALRAAAMKNSTRLAAAGMGGAAWGAGIAGEGATMHVLGGMSSFLSSGQIPLYLQAESGEGSHHSFSEAMSESMVKAMLFRFMGQAGQKVFGAGMQAGGANAAASYLAMESFSGAGGTAIELAFMTQEERQKQAVNPTFWIRSMLQNAIVSAGTHYAHGKGGEINNSEHTNRRLGELGVRETETRAAKETAAAKKTADIASNLGHGGVSSISDTSTYSFITRERFFDLETIQSSANPGARYNPRTDPEFLKLDTDKSRENYLETKVKEFKTRLLYERTTPALQENINQMAALMVGGSVNHQKTKYQVAERLQNTIGLPPDWQSRLINSANPAYVEGKSNILVLRNAESGGGDKYLIINGESLSQLDMTVSSVWPIRENSNQLNTIRTEINGELTRINNEIREDINHARTERMRIETSARNERIRSLQQGMEQGAANAFRNLESTAKPVLDSPYARELMAYGRNLRSDPEISKLPQGERRAAISERIRAEAERIRAKIQDKQNKIGKISDELFAMRKANPTLPVENLNAIFRERAKELQLELSPEEQKQIENKIAKIAEKQAVIERYYQSNKETPEALFVDVFGFQPTGKVELIRSEFSINFRVHSAADIEKIYAEQGAGVLAESTMAVNVPASRIADLAGTVNVIRGGTRQTMDLNTLVTHEERHAINRFLQPESMVNFLAIRAASDVNEMPKLRSLCRRYLENSLQRAQDEISAYMEQGMGREQLSQQITVENGQYDYWNALRQRTAKTVIENFVGARREGESNEAFAQRKIAATRDVESVYEEYRGLHNRRVKEMVAGAFETPHPVQNIIAAPAQLGRAGRRSGVAGNDSTDIRTPKPATRSAEHPRALTTDRAGSLNDVRSVAATPRDTIPMPVTDSAAKVRVFHEKINELNAAKAAGRPPVELARLGVEASTAELESAIAGGAPPQELARIRSTNAEWRLHHAKTSGAPTGETSRLNADVLEAKYEYATRSGRPFNELVNIYSEMKNAQMETARQEGQTPADISKLYMDAKLAEFNAAMANNADPNITQRLSNEVSLSSLRSKFWREIALKGENLNLDNPAQRIELSSMMPAEDFAVLDANRNLPQEYIMSIMNGGIERSQTSVNERGETVTSTIRVYGGNKINEGYYGSVSKCIYVEKGSNQIRQGVMKQPLPTPMALANFGFEGQNSVDLARFRAAHPEYADNMINPAFVSSDIIIYEKIIDGNGASKNLEGTVQTMSPGEWLRTFGDAFRTSIAMYRLEGVVLGDNKPGNIMVGRRGGVLIDPGANVSVRDIQSGRVQTREYAPGKYAAHYVSRDHQTGMEYISMVGQDNRFHKPNLMAQAAMGRMSLENVIRYSTGKSIEWFLQQKGLVGPNLAVQAKAPPQAMALRDLALRLSTGTEPGSLEQVYAEYNRLVSQMQ